MLEILYRESLCGKRKNNQDALFVKRFDNDDMLLAVADGMGGGVMGAELSQKAMSVLETLFDAPVEYPRQKLKQSVYTINEILHEMLSVYNIKDKRKLYTQKGGSTLSMVYYSAKKCKITYLNIGDSRVSICGKGNLSNLTIDQNHYEYKKVNNLDAKEEDKRFVYRILGISTDFEIDEILENELWSAIGQKTLMGPDDTVILSTDGFHDYTSQEMVCGDFHANFHSILEIIKSKSHDNITIIVAQERSCYHTQQK